MDQQQIKNIMHNYMFKLDIDKSNRDKVNKIGEQHWP